MSDENDGWISVNDALPGIGKAVEILFENSIVVFSTNIAISNGNFVFKENGGLMGNTFNSGYISHWRPLPERKPHFEKLREGDLLVVLTKDWKIISGFLRKIEDGTIRLSTECFSDSGYIGHVILENETKKITRISLEEKTFEEI
jgi:hypothetical protein